jgi:hypothetical protein
MKQGESMYDLMLKNPADQIVHEGVESLAKKN